MLKKYDKLSNLPMTFIGVSEQNKKKYFKITNCIYGDDFSAIQLVWTDMEGHFPFEKDFDERFNLAQPLLGDIDVLKWSNN